MLINFYWGLHPFPALYSSFVRAQGKPVGEAQPVNTVGSSIAGDWLWPLWATLPLPLLFLLPVLHNRPAGRWRVRLVLFFLGSQRISLLVNVNLSPKACSGSQGGRAPLGCRMNEDSLVASGVTLACVCFPGQEWSGTLKIFSKTHLLKEALLMIPIPVLIVSLLDNL